MIARFHELAQAQPPIGPKIPFAAHTVAYYHRDKNCNTKIYEHGDHAKHYGGAFNAWHRKGGGHTVDVRIEHLGYHLAWDIYDRYSKDEQPVDVVAHSMGGLLIRYALMATKLGVKDFPPFLLVEDVVTMGTPHGGSRLPGGLIPAATSTQDQQMLVDSPFLRRMARERYGYMPAGRDGTDWMTMGSGYDKLVTATSAAGVGPDANGKPVGQVHRLAAQSHVLRVEQDRAQRLLQVRCAGRDLATRSTAWASGPVHPREERAATHASRVFVGLYGDAR